MIHIHLYAQTISHRLNVKRAYFLHKRESIVKPPLQIIPGAMPINSIRVLRVTRSSDLGMDVHLEEVFLS